MQFFSRSELESIGKNGVKSYNGQLENKSLFTASRILSSFWICTKPTGVDIAENLIRDGFWESWITLWMSNNVKPGSVCIDAGANYGYFTFFLATHGCQVIAIEANRDLIPFLNKSTELNGAEDRVLVINKAITDRSWETVVLNVNEDMIGSSTLFPMQGAKSLEVDTISLNDVLFLKPHVDFIKMDIEGAEEKAWNGMQKLWDVNRNCTLLMEFSPIFYANFGKDLYELICRHFVIHFVDVDGFDKPVADYRFFENDLNEFKMLAIRRKDSDYFKM